MINIFEYENYVFAGNGIVAYDVLEILSNIEINCIGVILHPDESSREKDKLIKLAKKVSSQVWLLDEFNDYVRKNEADFGNSILISAYFGYIFPEFVLSSFKMSINLHPSFLPFSKGSYTNIWPIVEKTPAGVSIHRMTSDVDSGEIFVRKQIEILSHDTGKTLYKRLEKEAVVLFEKNIKSILKNEIKEKLDNKGGSYHIKRDVEMIDEINLDKQYRAGDLLDILRARTFDEYPSAYFIDKETQQKIFIRVQFIKENED